MNILYDYQILTMQKYGGVSRYFRELVKNISMYDDVDINIPVILSKNYYFEDYFGKKSVNKYLPKTNRLIGAVNQINTINYIKKNQYDIIHPTYYNPYILKKKSGKLVITVYDMINEIYPNMFPIRDKTVLYKKEMIFAADKIIAISENTKIDILKFYPSINENKIDVIYLGNSVEKRINKAINLNLPEKYVLFVGTRGGYKNFKTFLKAVNIVFKTDKNINLVCVGGGKFNKKELNKMNDLKIGKRIQQYDFTDDELKVAYRKAICFVFPSKYEGFGIPVLEAFSCKCPAILSQTSSLPEIGGEAALYINPDIPKDIAKKILDLIEYPYKRKELIDLGVERLKEFSWSNTSEKTMKLYKSLL